MLLRKINIVFVLLLLAAVSVCGQKRKVQQNPYIDNRIMHLGFFVGMHMQDMVLTNSGYVGDDGEAWFSEIPSYSPGFSVGLLGDLYLTQFLSLRLSPTLTFGEKKFVFQEANSDQSFSAGIRSNYMTIPVDLRLNSFRLNNYRPYILVGGYGAFTLGRRKNEAILQKPFDAGIQIGMGCDFYLSYFKLCPELRFSFGLLDAVDSKRSDLSDKSLEKYSNAIASGRTRMISLIFNFE